MALERSRKLRENTNQRHVHSTATMLIIARERHHISDLVHAECALQQAIESYAKAAHWAIAILAQVQVPEKSDEILVSFFELAS